MKFDSFSTFELADLLLSHARDWVLVRVHSSYAVFENPDDEFLWTRAEIIENIRRQQLMLTGINIFTTASILDPVSDLRPIGALL